MARTTPFAMNAPDQFRMATPAPHLTSGAYAKAYNEVKEKGASDLSGHTRTEEETAVGRFFSGGPGAYWHRLQRDLVVSQSLDLGDSARMFALVAMSTADALIAAWDTKIAYNFWRPVTAIRDAALDGTPKRPRLRQRHLGRRSSTLRTIPTTPAERTTSPPRRRRRSRACLGTTWSSGCSAM